MAKTKDKFHPDNMIEGKNYRFWYKTASGIIQREDGKFIKMEIIEGMGLSLWFAINLGGNNIQDVPFEVQAIHRVKEIL